MSNSRTLAAAKLVAEGACHDQVVRFRALFGSSVEVTEALCVQHHDKFEWTWARKALLSSAAQYEYYKAVELARAEYYNAHAAARAEYYKAVESALAKYYKAHAAAQAEYYKAYAAAWAEYDKARAAAQAEYDKTHAAAFARAYIGDI